LLDGRCSLLEHLRDSPADEVLAPIGGFDLIIASIALEQGEKLVTRNVKHFSRVPGLATEQW